jgi:UDP-2-acetamido-3-amino-2,3-dideoxy-glucuronate N-acetyltransferase
MSPIPPDAQIGKYCTIADDVRFGSGVVVHGFVNLYGCSLGDGVRIGPFVEIQKEAVLGNRVRVQSHTFICSNVVIDNDVFIGHNVTFINDRYPTTPKTDAGTWVSEPTHVSRGASIGSGATILCGVRIEEGALVGAGSVVTRDVPAHTVVAGVPAQTIRKLSKNEIDQGGQSANQL